LPALNALGNLNFTAARQQGYAPRLAHVRANDVGAVINLAWR
jgi:hypothetical protein